MNGNRTPAVTDDDADDEKRFAEYLKQHPDFFQRHQSLLTRLIIPHPTSGRTISLLERQVLALRDEQSAEQRRLRDLIRNARENDRLGRRMEELMLFLLSALSLDEMLDELPRKLRKIFDLEYVRLRPAGEAGSECVEAVAGDALCLRQLAADQRQWLFGDDADDIASCALVTIRPGRDERPFAFLAIGSTERSRYDPDSGTHYLKQMQRLLSASVGQLHAIGRS